VTDDVASSTVIAPIAELFRNADAFWATTYNLHLALFNEYLLRPPIATASTRRSNAFQLNGSRR
jgi:hypothetical protein